MTDRRLLKTPYPLGAHRETGGIRVSYVSEEQDCGVLLFDRKTGRRIGKYPFGKEERIGSIYCKWIPRESADDVSYLFYEGDRLIPDEHGRLFVSQASFGRRREDKDRKAGFPAENFPWEGDHNPRIPYENCICYLLHVRGFTKHRSSGVVHRGTFAGVQEKLPYLQRLGITTVELQPAYEFQELPGREEQRREFPAAFGQGAEALPGGEAEETAPGGEKINYWGYRRGCYYAPKSGYAWSGDAVTEFKEMVKAFHRANMEVVLQFYFPPEVPQQELPEILRFWVLEYHVDGFHLLGENLPVTLLAMDPMLTETKLWCDGFDTDRIYGEGRKPLYKNLAVYRDDYMYDMRRYLKGDEGMLDSVIYHMKHNPEKTGRIDYFTNYYGFTMMDMVSYNEKHNEANGEGNRDGSDYNLSWNCGTEGPTRKKQTAELRKKQIKNAMCMLFFSQSTPLIFMGDEFGNSQRGNNNPYCQDNETAWLDWRDLDKNSGLFDFVSRLTALRKKYPILHMSKELRIMDYLSCGYPDLSLHAENAWRPSFDSRTHNIGLMYCGKYAGTGGREDETFFYLALNMHWESHEFAMPRLPRGMKWEFLFGTDKEKVIQESRKKKTVPPSGEELCLAGNHKTVKNADKQTEEKWHISRVPPRSVTVFIGRAVKEREM